MCSLQPLKNCIGIRFARDFVCVPSELSRGHDMIASRVFLCPTFQVWSWKTHTQGMWIPDVNGSFVRRCRCFRMRYRAARLVQLSVHFQSKWRDAPFHAFLSIFDQSTPQCSDWRSMRVRRRYVNPGIFGIAVSFCVEVTNSLGHQTCASQRTIVGRIGVLSAPVLCNLLTLSLMIVIYPCLR